MANERTPAYTAILHKTGTGTEGGEHKVTIAENHIDIPNVSLKRNDQNKNDLFGLIQKTWSLDLNHVKVADKPGESEIVTDGTLAAYGTFARTFGDIMKNDEQTIFTISDKNNPIIEGRDNLKGCYFFHEGKWSMLVTMFVACVVSAYGSNHISKLLEQPLPSLSWMALTILQM